MSGEKNNLFLDISSAYEQNDSSKLKALYVLCDLVESYEYKDENIEGINEILDFLFSKLIIEKKNEIIRRISDAINLIFMYQDIRDFDFKSTIQYLERLDDYSLSNILEVLGYSRDKDFLGLLEKYKSHKSIDVREAAYMAIDFLKNTD
ncbi:hypothetical protein [Domibacillus iocasae]|uniref:Immunity protein 30 domain-containing protein n=1 Tax=Domibacillus iocasae TaxID=1714016 RepID=A0A1E7DQT8_9BACI|nr:hypothetical protein [Domibacillus iocasae]OES45450.1 hypothetical protein BA724_17515 [Domibacillus iocasae]